MIVIHQAIYGEVQGKTSGHGMLAASDEKDDLFRRISGYTDLADRPEGGILSGAIERGFIAEDYFLLIKTFPDKSPGLRSGRVFSHVLLIPNSDLSRVQNLSNLFQYHLPQIQKEAKMDPLEYRPQEVIPTSEAVNGREAAATNTFLQNQPFVWLGKEGFWEWVARIWPKLPTKVKQTIRIGAAFNPSYVKNEHISLLYIPAHAKTLWEKHSFHVIGTDESQTLLSSAANWLVGDTLKAEPFATLLEDFAPKIESIETINRLEDYGKAYHIIDKNPEINHLLILSHLISQISPKEEGGVKGKNKLLTAILQAIPNASTEMIMALIYQSWKGFPNAITSVSDALRDWLANHFLKGKQAKECGVVLAKALEAEKNNWWTSTVLDYVNNRLKRRQPGDALIIWEWMKNEHVLIAQHKFWLPDDAENELSQKIPKLEAAVAEAVLLMTKQKNWLVLHAKTVAQIYSAEKAIESQLLIDTDEDHTIAIEALSESIDGGSFVSEAVNHADPRLHCIAGKLISRNSKLMKGIDITSEGWQKCWKAAIEQGNEVWGGVSKPQQTLFEILDHILSGESFDKALLYAISTGKYSSLKDYPERPSVWPLLPKEARSEFVIATLLQLIDELDTSEFKFDDLESEIKRELRSQKMQHHIISDKKIPFEKKLKLFDVLPCLGELHAEQLMQNHHFSSGEAEQFGQLASKKVWNTIVTELYSTRFDRQDLVPALLECSHLLGFWERISLSVSGLKSDAVTNDEWWGTFLSKAVELYPLGPTQNGLWTNAGGKLEELHYQGVSGKQSWSFAIDHIRRGGSPSAKKLLQEMQREFKKDFKIAQLVQSL